MPRQEMKRKKFDNGLVLLTERTPEKKKAVLLVGVRVGSVNEPMRINGGSHFNEHLLFKSNHHRSARQIIEDMEYSGTVVNAYTTWKYTAFYAKTPPAELGNALQILFEAATNLNYDEEEFELERQVILTEIRNYINSPEKYSMLGLFIPTLFKGTPLEKKIEGTVESMGAVRKEELEDFKEGYYKPNNMVIAVGGRFDEGKLKEKIEETFGSLGTGGKNRVEEIDLGNKSGYLEEERRDITQMYLTLGYKTSGHQGRDYFKLDLLSSILSEGLSSRMFHELREKRGIGYSVGCLFHPLGAEGMFFSHVDGFDPGRLRETKETILGIFDDLRRRKVPKKEFMGTKKLMLSKYDDRLDEVTDRTALMLEAEIYDIPFDFRQRRRLIEEVSRQDLQDAAQEYLTDDYVTTLLKPQE